jgi:hypothetical protein
MKIIQHQVFLESAAYPVWAWNASIHRERSRERIRQKAEAFINEIGVDKVVSVAEHAPTIGRFSIVVWWYRQAAETDTPVIRASDENQNA